MSADRAKPASISKLEEIANTVDTSISECSLSAGDLFEIIAIADRISRAALAAAANLLSRTFISGAV